MNDSALKFQNSLLSLDYYSSRQLVEDFLEDKSFFDIVDEIFVPVLENIGSSWAKGSLSLSQVYMSGRMCETLISEFFNDSENKRKNSPKIAILVYNDQHTLGKRIIYNSLRSIGYEIEDFGFSEDCMELVNRVEKQKIQILLISVLMLNSAFKLKDVISEIKKRKLNTKVVVGGAPFIFDVSLWKRIGADAMGKDTNEAIKIVKKMEGEING